MAKLPNPEREAARQGVLRRGRRAAAHGSRPSTQLRAAVAAHARRRVGGPGKAQPEPASVATITVYPSSSPQAYATTQLVTRLRDSVIPPLAARTGMTVYVGGVTAGAVDFATVLGHKLPLFIGVVVLLSALLLMVVFRSLVIPLQAAVMNLLSIGASLGVIVAIFQWGWLGGLFGVQQGPIESFIPVMLFAIVFGLSMDYEVFLVSRIHERWTHTRDSSRAVAEGLALTGPRGDRGGGDHGVRVPVVHARRRPRDQGVRPEPRQRRVPRRAGRALPAAARDAASSCGERHLAAAGVAGLASLPRLNIEGTTLPVAAAGRRARAGTLGARRSREAPQRGRDRGGAGLSPARGGAALGLLLCAASLAPRGAVRGGAFAATALVLVAFLPAGERELAGVGGLSSGSCPRPRAATPPAQLLLDITQGARVASSAYPHSRARRRCRLRRAATARRSKAGRRRSHARRRRHRSS